MKAKRTRPKTSKKPRAQGVAGSGSDSKSKSQEPASSKPTLRLKRLGKAASVEPEPQPKASARPKRTSKKVPPPSLAPEPTPTATAIVAPARSLAARAKRGSKQEPPVSVPPKSTSVAVTSSEPVVIPPKVPAHVSKAEIELPKSQPLTQLPATLPKAETPAVEPKPQPPKPDFYIPKMLLEGDEPSPLSPPASPAPRLISPIGPRVSEPPSPVAIPAPATEKLPEAYGTGRLFLTARDPRCFYSHWDLTRDQLGYYNRLSIDGHLVLRVHLERVGEKPAFEVHVHPESRDWFIHVDRPGAPYVAELGCYTGPGQWRTIAVSDPAFTPVPSPRVEATQPLFVHFRPQPITPGRDLPPFVLPNESRAEPFAPLQTPAANRLSEQMIPAQAESPERWDWSRQPEGVQPGRETFTIRSEAYSRPLEPPQFSETRGWTATEEQELKTLMGLTIWRQEIIDSAQFAELISVAQPGAISSAEQMQIIPEMAPSSAEAPPRGAVTSPGAPEVPPALEFWFNVNAELVIYGATEPDAQVSIGGRTIKLRPDGTFSYRFSLPDGNYALPIQARAAHGDTRNAELTFRRATRFTGEVGHHPQDPALKPPQVQNIG